MNVKYYKDDDLLVIRLSNKQFKAAEKIGSFIIHYDAQNDPVLLEILNASTLLRETNRALPVDVREKVLPVSSL
ncbi:hypothetical protein A2696_00315 [Candidatus Curtissbacteria bacterium RIFCSPHIGHO2_01_FULL_41_13]|uniref:DUF2283 domain-containing protein n=1 Tax=Candidatus Curtissbacteria bacterium RIFCSPHIGHO2_01_FULL_41_13 TaxID=1797745 RepID=A0A1F5G2D9_9BACT|nr:MAG: hypothetical protein A2696_00315 [Candidatus Curtissbacteria bacterium RIFCSPHIGHO2_01_FULL_41_13]